MRTSMVYPIRFWALILAGLLLYQFSTEAIAGSCKFEKNIDMTLDLSNSELLSVSAAAGDLEIVGVPGSSQAVIHGRACVSKEEWLEKTGVSTAPGKHAEINVYLPKTNGGWSFIGINYVWLDLKIQVPQELALKVKDSSGAMLLKNIAAVDIQDSSGDIDLEKVGGPVSIRDSSGDIDIDGTEGDVTIVVDSSGDIDVTDVNGTVLVKKDSSGDIKATDVTGDVIVERDSSGSISVIDVGGDFRVLKDSSGGIKSRDVMGEIDIPQKG